MTLQLLQVYIMVIHRMVKAWHSDNKVTSYCCIPDGTGSPKVQQQR